MTALGVLLKEQMMASLRAKSFEVVDLPRVSESAVLPRVHKLVADFTDVGKEARRRGTLEGERHYCGNGTEVLTNAPVLLTDRDKIATVLDARTCNFMHFQGRPGLTALMKECMDLLLVEYAKYGTCAAQFVAKKKAASEAAAALRVKKAGAAVNAAA